MSGVGNYEIDQALKSEEVKLVLDRVKSENERAILKRDLLWRRADIAIDIAKAGAEAEQAAQRLRDLRAQIYVEVNAGRHAERFIGSVVVVLIVGFIGAAHYFFGWQWARGLIPVWKNIWATPWWTVALWGSAALAIFILAWEILFVAMIAPRREKKLQVQHDLTWFENVAKMGEDRLERRMASVVAGYLAEAINNRAAPLFSARMQVYVEDQTQRVGRNAAIGIGLSEVVNEENIISTAPRTRIVEMIERLPGGSIGISGPRGVGKTTLLNALCRTRDRLGTRRIIAVSTAAPVEYQARDFLLHLFSSLCRRVLDEERVDRVQAERELAERELADWQRTSWAGRTRTISKLLLVTILASLGVAAVIGFANSQAAKSTTVPVARASAPPNDKAAVVSTLGFQRRQEMAEIAKTSQVGTPQPASAPVASKSADSASPSASIFGVTPGPFLTLALIATFLLFIGAVYDPSGFLPLPGSRRRARDRAPLKSILDVATNYAIAEQSARELRNIHFQRSYTSGWSGAIKFPAGIDIGASATLALQQQAESLPELVERFRAYVAAVSEAYGTVLFGIDELDKLRSASEGEAFLNGVKSVFGIANCFYLISVSEDALSAFDRRGIGIRDAFDSALDEVIHVDFLDVVQARALLSRRILRLPDPFLQLCYMLSGGLPRDLIRHARQLLEVAAAKKERRITLRDAVKALAAADLGAKLRATQVAIRALKELPQTNGLLAQISELPHEGPLSHLEKQLAAYRTYLETIDRDTDDDRRLARLADELAAYMEAMILTRRTGSIMDSKYGWEMAENAGLADRVASVRQALEVSVPLAEARIKTVREAVFTTGNKIQQHIRERAEARTSDIEAHGAAPEAA